jgi:hypothetical protein
VEEFGTLGWKSSFNDCIKTNAIVDVINSQSLHHNIKKTSKTIGMLPIKLGHNLKCGKKILTFP